MLPQMSFLFEIETTRGPTRFPAIAREKTTLSMGRTGQKWAMAAARNVDLRHGPSPVKIVVADASLLSHALVCASNNVDACVAWIMAKDPSPLRQRFRAMLEAINLLTPHFIVLFEGVPGAAASSCSSAVESMAHAQGLGSQSRPAGAAAPQQPHRIEKRGRDGEHHERDRPQ